MRPPYETRTGYVNVEGAELYYEDTGQGVPVILVHGTSGYGEVWQQQVPALTEAGFRAIVFDLRSFGRSRARPGQGNAGSIAEDIEQIRQALGLTKVFLVGQSHGAEGALEYALDYRSQTLGIVIAATWRGAEDEPAYAELRRHLSPSEQQIQDKPRIEIQFSSEYIENNAEGIKQFQTLQQRYSRSGIPDGVSLRESVQKRRAPSDYARLSHMQIPVLVLAGERDTITSPALMKTLASHIPGAEFTTLPASGRYSFWENPEAFNRALIGFFAEQTDPARQ